MVVKMMKWRAWPRKFEVRLVVKSLDGLRDLDEMGRLKAEVKWKGSKIIGLSSLKGVKRSQTGGGVFDDDGVLQWNEEFRNFCSFVRFKENGVHSWEVVVTVLNGSNQDVKNKQAFVVGTASLNLGEYVSSANVKELELNVPLRPVDGFMGSSLLLKMSLSLLEVKSTPDTVEVVCGSIGTTTSYDASALSPEKEKVSGSKKRKKKANLFKGCVTAPKLEETNLEDGITDGNISNKSEINDRKSDFDMDSVEDFDEGVTDEGREDSNILQPLSYGPLTYVNFGHSNSSYSGDIDDWIYCSSHKPHVVSSPVDNAGTSVQDPSVRLSPKHRFLSWRKRKLGFKSTKTKGEPLLKKDCREEGGDDIDFDRRQQLTSSDESSFGWRKAEDGSTTSRSSFSEFEDEGFCVGVWEKREIACRDGQMKLETEVFFASMDQRSVRAAGESACTALVAVIADWLQTNKCDLPNKSEFDRLIRDGSSEWRNLCENQTYMKRFPDKHFDLETVLEARIRPLLVIPEKSFVGFFHPEGIEEENCFDILHGSMSFDEIWDEISRQALELNETSSPLLYIVSWNDHFLILKVEQNAYYIIDTLGERLFEGCNQAYFLKFDNDTRITQILKETQVSGETGADNQMQQTKKQEGSPATNEKHSPNDDKGSSKSAGYNVAERNIGEITIASGKDSIKEYIKSFLAAIPIRQLQTDIKKGLTSVPLHHRLQIEFHFTDIKS